MIWFVPILGLVMSMIMGALSAMPHTCVISDTLASAPNPSDTIFVVRRLMNSQIIWFALPFVFAIGTGVSLLVG